MAKTKINQAVVDAPVVAAEMTTPVVTADEVTAVTEVEQPVAVVEQVVDAESTKPAEVVNVEQVKTKAERALEIFHEVNGVRADFMKRVAAELNMSKAGGSTYFQNCKTKASGGKVKHYYKPKSTINEEKIKDAGDDSKEDADVFEVELKDGNMKCFLSQQALDEFKAENPDLIK